MQNKKAKFWFLLLIAASQGNDTHPAKPRMANCSCSSVTCGHFATIYFQEVALDSATNKEK
jgi:hypothetical protein